MLRDNEITSAPPEEVASQNGNPEDSSQVVSFKRIQTTTVMVDRVVGVSISDPLVDGMVAACLLLRAILS